MFGLAKHVNGSGKTYVCYYIGKVINKYFMPYGDNSHKYDSNMLWMTQCYIAKWPGPSCSKLTMSLVHVSLKFQMYISNIGQYFLSRKCEKSFSNFFSKKYQCTWLLRHKTFYKLTS